MPRIEGRPGASLPPFDFGKLKTELQERHPEATDRDVMSAALYPQVTEDYLTFRESFGPVDKLDTRIFLTGPKVGEEFEVSTFYFYPKFVKQLSWWCHQKLQMAKIFFSNWPGTPFKPENQ